MTTSRRRLAQLLAGLAGCLILVPMLGSEASAAAPGGTWRSAQEVPGTASLNADGNAETRSVSCASAGNCAAGGLYTDSAGRAQAFVASQSNGIWRTAIEVPGTATLNAGGTALVLSVSCASAGNCAAGGLYADSSGHQQAFVVNETHGIWRKAKKVPGTATLNVGTRAAVKSVSCAAAGNCGAGGFYTDGSGDLQAFVVNESNGIWRTAIKVPGTATLNVGTGAEVNSLSCASAGNCAAGGFYTGRSDHREAFVASETNGIWRTAKQVPGTATLNAGGTAATDSVSCASAGNCAAGGFYIGSSNHEQAFVVNETHGIWRTARKVPGTANLNAGNAETDSVSCASAGNCSAGGSYTDHSGRTQVFVVNRTHGTWRTARQIPGTAALNVGGIAAMGSVSCASAGNCSAVGFYTDGEGPGNRQAFVVDESNGTWRTAREMPGTAALNASGNAEASSVSCASPSSCAAGGFYTDSSPSRQALVANKT